MDYFYKFIVHLSQIISLYCCSEESQVAFINVVQYRLFLILFHNWMLNWTIEFNKSINFEKLISYETIHLMGSHEGLKQDNSE